MNKTAVLYARFSCSKQREASIADQLRECHAYAKRDGIQVIREYTDYAMSGKTDDRPAFQEMISNAGESDYVIVYMSDRFSRDPYDAPLYKRELQKHGVKLISAIESIPDSPEGIIYEKLLEGLAACESAKTSIRTKRGMTGNALKCEYLGDRVYGYDVDNTNHYTINKEQAAIVQEVFNRRENGESMNYIAHDLALRGVTTYRGKPCSPTMICNMLRNEKYTGVYIWGDIRVPDGMPRIIEPEQFKTVQGIRGRKQRKVETWDEYPLSGKAICVGCGANMIGVSGRNRQGNKYTYYQCADKCGTKNIRQDLLESAIVDAVRNLLSSRQKAVEIAQKVVDSYHSEEHKMRLKRARKSLREAKEKNDNILRAIEQGIIPSGAKERMQQLQEQEAQAVADIKRLEQEVAISVDDMADFLQFGATLDDKAVLDVFVCQVLIGSKQIIATLNVDNKKREPIQLPINLDVFEDEVNGSPVIIILEHVPAIVFGRPLLVA